MTERVDFYGTGFDELHRHLGGSGRVSIPWREVRRGRDPFAPGVLAEGARARLFTQTHDLPLEVAQRTQSECGTIKLGLGLSDRSVIETVVIPSPRRTTVCVSSQVGCARNCQFCMTATLGLVRNLTCAEIVGQVILARREIESREFAPLRNIVFMGMGEPLDNPEAVEQALGILTDTRTLGVGPSRITVSTVGTHPAAILRAGTWPAHLAWSLHSADEQVRQRLIPTNRRGLLELRDAFVGALRPEQRDLFVEITLMSGVNDRPEHARAMAGFLEPFGGRARINLLPLNPGRPGFAPAGAREAEAYRDIMYQAGYRCIIRQARGTQDAAACGQLAGKLT